MPEDIHVGEVVRLKSGGPSMTVSEADAASTVKCAWFVGKEIHFASFGRSALEASNGKKRKDDDC
jgi:uncharacterized protein YodC (DUF2158 family)